MKISLRALFVTIALTLLAQGNAIAQHSATTFQPSFAQPTISPHGHKIVFVSDGALWIVPATGGTARLLISDSAADSHPLYSPNGKFIAFTSDKTGNGDIYLLNLSSGRVRRVTWSDAPDQVSGWSPDSRWIYFTSDRNNIGYMGAIYRVRASGGTPMPVSLELYRNEEEGVPSPNNREIALVGQGWGSTQWWRHGHAHIDDGAIWLLKNNGSHDYRRLTPDNARALWPMWSPSGHFLYYMSDRSGTDNIWEVQMTGHEISVTHFTHGRCLWPTITTHGHTIAFQRNFGIWTLNTESGKANPVLIRLGGAVLAPGLIHKTFTKHYSQLAVSPDGKKLVFTVHGQIYAAPADQPGPAFQLTHQTAAHFEVSWSPNSQEIVYSTERDGPAHLYIYDFTTGKQKRLTDSSQDDTDPQFSPNGKWIAFIRNANQLRIINLQTGHMRLLATGELNLHHPLESHHPFSWSPDSRWIAFMAWGARMYRNAEIISVSGGKPRPISFLGNTFSGSLQWSPNGKSLFFETGQRTHKGHVAQVHLVPATPHFRRQQFLNLFHGIKSGNHISAAQKLPGADAVARLGASTKPAHVKVDFKGIDTRLKLLPIGLNVQQVRLSPNGKLLLITAKVAGQTNLYTWSLNPLAIHPPIAHQITSSPGKKASAQFSSNGKRIWYLNGGKIYSVPVAGGNPKRFATRASMEINFNAEKKVVFNEAWRWLAVNYHNPKMNGVNWVSIHRRYAPLVNAAETRSTLRRILLRMVGELDSSHSGVYSGRPMKMNIGRIGLLYSPGIYAQKGRFRISQIIPNSPAAITGKIAVGDYLIAVDGHRLNARTNLHALFARRVGKQTRLTIAHRSNGGRPFHVDVKPVNANTMTHLTYLAWTEKNRAYVSKLSHGKLGYIDLPNTSMKSLKHLYREINAINATREGVVIDVRNNYGGFVSAYALDALARRHYLNMTFRGMHTVAARPLLGQAALERPTILVTNRVTLSDGEDFTEGYEELGLGKVVGDPTAGWIIYTSDVHLLNGMIVRLPFITVTTASGKPMELHPRPVNVQVAQPLGESYRGEDNRLKAAVRILLNQINSSRKLH